MKRFLLLALDVFLCSCKTKHSFVMPPAEVKEVIVERLVAYELPADSAHFQALLACDSLNNVFLKEISEYKSQRYESLFSLNENVLSYNLYRPPDTVYVKATDSIRTEKIPYPVEVPVKVNELTKFQSFQIKAAWTLETILVCFIVFSAIRTDIFSIIKNLIKKWHR